MHRTLLFNGDPKALDRLGDELRPMTEVISLAHHRGTSLKPAGDVLQVEVLNRSADEVLRRAAGSLRDGSLSVAVNESTCLLHLPRQESIENDADDALWEEMQSGLRNHSRVSANFLILMAMGGVVASAGLVLDSVSQTMAFVA